MIIFWPDYAALNILTYHAYIALNSSVFKSRGCLHVKNIALVTIVTYSSLLLFFVGVCLREAFMTSITYIVFLTSVNNAVFIQNG